MSPNEPPFLAGPVRTVGPVRDVWHARLHLRGGVRREQVGRDPRKVDVAVGGDSRVAHVDSWSLLLFEPDVLVGRRVRVGGNQGQARLVNLWSHTSNESIFPDRSEHDAIVEDPLDLMEQLLALFAVELLATRGGRYAYGVASNSM